MTEHKKTIVGLLGPSTGGKSSLINGICNHHFGVMSFAAYLKEVATRRGWSGLKDASGRAFLQKVSEDMKAEYGEDVFFRIGLERALHAQQPVIIFDDMRFLIEIIPTITCRDDSFNGHVLVLEEPEAEHKWEVAVLSDDPKDAWAKHRSECEWRSVRHMFPSFFNNKALGLDLGIDLFHEFITEHIKAQEN